MSIDKTTTEVHGATLEQLRRLDSACSAFEEALKRGESPQIEVYLDMMDAGSRADLLRELLILEFDSQANLGIVPQMSTYRERFPAHSRLIKYLYLEYFVPAQIGEFSVQRLLGRGGYGFVYQAWDSKLTRTVAIKVIRRKTDLQSKRGGNLLAEARAVAQLRHPGVVTVHAIPTDEDGDEFLVLEYVAGRSLEDLLKTEQVAPRRAVELMIAIAEAIRHAHQQGLIHRDLKPANILLDQSGQPRVTDFGLALHLATSRRLPEIAGTLAYMSPEQAGGETHRLDARTDIWAAGVILYRMLTGRLPFSGGDHQELINAILYADPKPFIEGNRLIPAELILIVERCLAKRMSDRYRSVAELIEDLQFFLAPHAETLTSSNAAAVETMPVVPKGLRCFDRDDREFFLRLVPGPRDRHGAPRSVRLWERHLSETAIGETFQVGLLYGPSGCGKSSLLRAGVLPRLAENIRTIVVEATRDNTEIALIRALRREFPDMTADYALPEMIRDLRMGDWLKPGEKLVLIFDQFEQWLHGWNQKEVMQLLEALRQCDGGRVQALILVRDDFWMPATRLFKQLDVPLVDTFNTAAVDLFDRAHAMKVLEAFGIAFGHIEPRLDFRSDDQRRFLERAIDELVQDGWVVPVRLCIFAEMVKSRPWVPATLREVGGAQGLGTAFLESVFDSRDASPMHRLHRQAARQVLELLLPPPGTNIRGHLAPESELRAVSGYEGRPDDFGDLLQCLDNELRLITPSDNPTVAGAGQNVVGASATPVRHYQLTHDFLINAIHTWLNASRRRTLRGRADLRLAELAEAYSVRPETRQLPSWTEWIGLVLLTRRRHRKPSEQRLMHAATHRHAWRSGIALAAIAFLCLLVYDRTSAIHADGLVQALKTTETRDLPRVVRQLAAYRRWAEPRVMKQSLSDADSVEQRARVLLGQLAVGTVDFEELNRQLLEVEAPLAVIIGDLLFEYGTLQRSEDWLWNVANDARAAPAKRLRACTALAHLPPNERASQWLAVADGLQLQLLREVSADPQDIDTLVDAFLPVGQWLVKPLKKSFVNPELSEADGFLVAKILARYLADAPDELAKLGLQSAPRQFSVIARALAKYPPSAWPEEAREAECDFSSVSAEEEKDRLARRKANAILLLRSSGDDKVFWSALAHGPDPRLRSYLLNQLGQMPTAASGWLEQFDKEKNPGIRQAIILLIGAQANTGASGSPQHDITDVLLRLFHEDRDPGVHAAVDWTLRRMRQDAQLKQATEELATLGMREGFLWYVTKSKVTMAIIKAPGKVQFGSPDTEPGRDKKDEALWTGNIEWSFAISMNEITQAQFLAVMPEYEAYVSEAARQPNAPANLMTWREAMEYCQLLSQQDGRSAPDSAAPTGKRPQKLELPDVLTSVSYRLPLEVEWEIACRAGTLTPRFYGNDISLLSSYCCYILNSSGQTWTVGHGMPNALGMFDILGNVSEWCYDSYVQNRELKPTEVHSTPTFTPITNYAYRGSEFNSMARMVRSANRNFARSEPGAANRGLRIVHTILPVPSE